MNWAQKTKKLLVIAMLYTACATPSLRGNASDDFTNSDAYLQGVYDEQHQNPSRSYLLSRKKRDYAQGREDARSGKSDDKVRALAIKFKANRHYFAKQSSGAELYDHGPMYGNPNIPGR